MLKHSEDRAAAAAAGGRVVGSVRLLLEAVHVEYAVMAIVAISCFSHRYDAHFVALKHN